MSNVIPFVQGSRPPAMDHGTAIATVEAAKSSYDAFGKPPMTVREIIDCYCRCRQFYIDKEGEFGPIPDDWE